MGERRAAPAPQPITRSDAKAVVEFTDSSINRFIGNRKDFEFGGTETRIGFYEDGSKKLTGNPMTIIVHKGESRTIQISGREARVSKDENYFELMGPVR